MTIKQIIADIIAKEGGYVNHPADRGGPTNYGITAMSYADYFKRPADNITKAEIKAVTPQLAEKIYYSLYFVRPNINLLPELIQPLMLDMSVNHGPNKAIELLQTTLLHDGYNISTTDGLIGPKTLNAVTRATADLGKHLINNLINSRIQFYKQIVKHDPSQAVFENGWIARAESFRPTATA